MITRIFKQSYAIILVLTLILSSRASFGAAPENLSLLEPYIEPDTLAVGRIDLARIDIDTFLAKVESYVYDTLNEQQMMEFRQTVQQQKTMVEDWLAEFTGAGGRDIYVVQNMIDIPHHYMIVPIADDGNADALMAALRKIIPENESQDSPIYKNTFVRRGGVIFAGMDSALQRLEQASPARRPALREAFGLLGTEAIQIALIPNAVTVRVIEEMAPAALAIFGDSMPIIPFPKGLQWTAAGIALPPGMHLNVTIQYNDSSSAQAFQAMVNAYLDYALKLIDNEKVKDRVTRYAVMLRPEVEKDRVQVRLSSGQIDTLVKELVVGMVLDVRSQALNTACMVQLKQIGLAVILYANDHGDRFPAQLADLTKSEHVEPELLLKPELLRCPVCGEAYIYRGAGLKTAQAGPHIILAHDSPDCHGEAKRNVLFADGHVENMMEWAFQDAIERDNAWRKENELPVLPAEPDQP